MDDKAAPIFERIRGLCAERSAIITECNALGISHEAAWLSQGNRGIRDREFRREIQKYESLLQRALAQRPLQAAALQEAEVGSIQMVRICPDVYASAEPDGARGLPYEPPRPRQY